MTGAGRNLGRAVALALAQSDADVTINVRTDTNNAGPRQELAFAELTRDAWDAAPARS